MEPPPTARPYRIAWVSTAVSASLMRSVFGCTRGSFVRPCCSRAQISSWRKSRSRRYGPCSNTTISKPACASSFATTPPAAPAPTMTKSTGLAPIRGLRFEPPAHAPAKRCDMGNVMLAVPGVHGDQLINGDQPVVFGVQEGSRPLDGTELPQQGDPAVM